MARCGSLTEVLAVLYISSLYKFLLDNSSYWLFLQLKGGILSSLALKELHDTALTTESGREFHVLTILTVKKFDHS